MMDENQHIEETLQWLEDEFQCLDPTVFSEDIPQMTQNGKDPRKKELPEVHQRLTCYDLGHVMLRFLMPLFLLVDIFS